MKRTRLERTAPISRSGPPRRTSAKRRRTNLVRAALAHEYLGALCRIRSEVCTRDAENFHELVGRAQGGSLVDRRNLVPACQRCNGWIEDNPKMAVLSRWKVPRPRRRHRR